MLVYEENGTVGKDSALFHVGSSCFVDVQMLPLIGRAVNNKMRPGAKKFLTREFYICAGYGREQSLSAGF